MSAVVVNEARIFATGQGADWWATWLHRQPESRVEVLVAGLGGSRLRIVCDDPTDAAWLAATINANTVDRSACVERSRAYRQVRS